jgi:4-hydroxybenzoate polyprenyltransferase
MLLKKFIEFLCFSSIFVGLCAVSMCIETNLLLHLPLSNISFYAFVFGATLIQYNLHYFIKKTANQNSTRLNWSAQNRGLHRILVLIGLVLVITSLFSFHLRHFLFLILLGLISFLYSVPILPFRQRKRIKDFGLLKIITLSFMWTLITVWFPIVESPFPIISFQLIFLRRFIFIFVLCLLFDVRDIQTDKAENIRTLPVIVGVNRSHRIAYILMMIFILLSLIQYAIAFDIIQLAAMLISAFATFIIVRYSKNNRNDLYYLGAVDGMMLLQALLVITGEFYLH